MERHSTANYAIYNIVNNQPIQLYLSKKLKMPHKPAEKNYMDMQLIDVSELKPTQRNLEPL